jgi:hypothetical protein
MSNEASFTVSNAGFEADVAPRPNGSNTGILTISDWVQIGRFAAGLDIPICGSEFQRVDVAPRGTLGNASLTIADWVQAGRYVSGLDPITPAGGPTCFPDGPPLIAEGEGRMANVEDGTSRLVQIGARSIKPGKVRVVSISLEALGNENALGFSLNFNPAQLRYVSAKTGIDAREATLIINADQSVTGGLRVSLALPPGQHFEKGRRQLVDISFKPLLRDGNPIIGFSDQSSALEVVDANADQLAADFFPLISSGKGRKSVNPIDEARFFVNQSYLDFLGRTPEPQGLDFWTSQIILCGTDQRCIHDRRVDISAAFFMEEEFQRTGFVVHRFYTAAYGRSPSYDQFLNDHLKLIDTGYASPTEEFARQFTLRPEFRNVYPDSWPAELFVTRLFKQAGIQQSARDQREMVDSLKSGRKTRAQVMLQLVNQTDFADKEYNRAFVLMQYFAYLRRDPDPAGYEYWLSVLNSQQPANYRGMVCSFLTSEEYQRRFGPVAARSNADCGQ